MSESLRCLYAENLKNSEVTVTIDRVRIAPERVFVPGKNDSSEAWDIIFKEKGEGGDTVYIQIPSKNKHGKSCGLLRQYVAKCGGEPCEDHKGTKITLYPVKSARAATKQAIRIKL